MTLRPALFLIGLAGFSFCWEPPAAQAQGRIGRPAVNQYSRPATSPYLNLLRNDGRDFSLNYFRLVRPELEFRQANAQQFQSIERLRRRVEEHEQQLQSPTSSLGPTGHATSFLNYRGYFGRGTAGATSRGPARRGR